MTTSSAPAKTPEASSVAEVAKKLFKSDVVREATYVLSNEGNRGALAAFEEAKRVGGGRDK
jgi:hypothetical protein